ncbi:MAG: sodium/proton-translocating pyrophosphatase [Mogibacterium sp.]|nr:sodium/proton-translocating pyrophosphatase [Mogibacterium sp.]
MKTTIVLICSIASVIFAFLLGSWLRGKKGTGKENARIYAVLSGRNKNFRTFQYFPVAAAVVIVAAAAGPGIGMKQSAACLAGALTVLVPLAAGSFSLSDGVTAAYNEAVNGDIKQSLRAGYRAGTVLGSWITGICLAVFCLVSFVMKTAIADYAASFALGAVLCSMVVHTGGEVYSSAYSLAVPSKDFTDRTGSYMAAGADFAGSYVVAAASAVLLSDVAVATSGVTSTFTARTAELFPLMIYAAGIAGTVIGTFIQRAGTGKDYSRGTGACSIAAGIITAAASFWFSMDMMQTRVYAWAVTAGIAAGLILSSVSRLFSSDSIIFMNGYKTDRSLGKYSSVVFNLGSGMVSTAIYTVIVIAAVAVSYMFASYYGVALCAVGMCAILGSASSIAGLTAVSGSVSDIIVSRNRKEDEALKTVSDTLYTVSAKSLITGKTYAAVTGSAATLAAFCAFFYSAGTESIDIMSLRVFGGIISGAAAAFILAGMLISSVRITGRVALRDIGRNDDETGATSAIRGAVLPAVVAIALPVLIGLFAGPNALAGFVISSAVTGYLLVVTTNNSGIHLENTAVQSMSSLLKAMAVFSVAFLPVFMKIGGFLFR